ncbi:MAG: hypothetical protein JWR38_5503 [Mucilaginibacter sp.]|nr:hypothetical protein [Mucilaginibacter sp.]
MKAQQSLILLSVICLSFLFTRCAKDADAYPDNDMGMIYNGTTTPDASKGIAGDFYLNTATGLLYGPKTDDGWGAGFSLKGVAGSAILNGTGLPAGSTGSNGDYYIDKTNYLLYGPKTASGWGTPVSLQGPAGDSNAKTTVFTLTNTDWLYSSSYNLSTGNNGVTEGYTSRYIDQSNTLITADLLKSGMVLVYFNPIASNTAQWQPLPFSFTDTSGGFTRNYAYETAVGRVRFHFYFVKLTGTPPDLSAFIIPTTQYKVVVVSGTLTSSLKQSHININNYSEVSKFLGIQ